MRVKGRGHKWTNRYFSSGSTAAERGARPPLRWLGRHPRRGRAGPANVRLGVDEAIRQVLEASRRCLAQASSLDSHRIVACLALAGATEPIELEAARTSLSVPARVVTTDAHAACVGAHRGEDGGVIIVGTGTVAWAVRRAHHRVGGWGFPISDEGSGAWLGCELARRVFWAHDGRVPWTGLLTAAFERFGCDPMRSCAGWGRRSRAISPSWPLWSCNTRSRTTPSCELMQSAATHRRLAGGSARSACNGSRWPADCRRASSLARPGDEASVGSSGRRCARRRPVARSSGSRVLRAAL